MIWILFILGLAFADKLDRTYLPPPGSTYSGGSPGAIDVPLEYPKLHSSAKSEYFNPEIAIGIDRVAPKRPVIHNTYSSINNSSTYPGNTFTAPTNINSYPQNTVFQSKNEYSTASPINNSFDNFSNIQNPDHPKNFYNNRNQLQYTSDSNENHFQTTDNHPKQFQGNFPITDINRNDFSNSPFSNQTKLQGNKNIIINDISQSSPSPQLPVATDFINKQYGPGQYSSSSIPTVHPNTNLIASTLSPSTVTYDNYGTSVGPKQYYTSTLKPPQYSTTIPIGSKISPAYNYANIKNRPERIQAQADIEASILNYESSISPEGYAYSYDTSNGIHGDESGVTVDGVKARGSYSYIGDDGKLYNVVYTADEYGFQPRGDHLPTSPPIPDAILKVIEQVSKEKEAGIVDDGSYDENKYGYRKYHNGFYSPKSDFSNVHSGIGKGVIANTKKNNHNIILKSGGTRNKIANKTNKQSDANQSSAKNTDTIPVMNSYINSDNNLENLGSQLPQQPYEFDNKSDIKHVTYDSTDLQTGDDTSNKSPNLIDNERRQLVNQQTTVGNGGKYNNFAAGLNEENKTNETNNKDSYTERGYEYNPPQHRGNNDDTRFSDIYNGKKGTIKQENSNKIVRKPFLTPYVSETNEGRPFENLEDEEYEEDLIQSKEKDPSYFDSDFNKNNGYNRTDFFDIKSDNDPIRKLYLSEENKVSDRNPQTVSEGYFYQQGKLDSGKASYDPLAADRHSYSSSTATSTVVPTAFTSRINTIQSKKLVKDPKYSAGILQPIGSKTVVPSTTYTPNLYQTNIHLNKTNNLPDYSTIRPGFINQHEGNIPRGTKLGYPTKLKNTTPGIEFSTNIPIIRNSYAPNLEITHNDENNVKSTTEKIIGEDFSGPKQPQRFDPLTGYYY